jgi:periplasmic protein CpxP/Spy
MRPNTQLILGITFGAALFASPLAWADSGGQCSRQGSERHAMSHHGRDAQGGVSAHILRHLLKNKQELGLTDEQHTYVPRRMSWSAKGNSVRCCGMSR